MLIEKINKTLILFRLGIFGARIRNLIVNIETNTINNTILFRK